jgi:peptidoglycan/xylan/chitin deacetylase (PgdA/CDA1 family)
MMSNRTAERIPVLMYHRIGEPVDHYDRKYCVRPGDFARQMDALATRGYTAVSLDAFFSWLDRGAALHRRAFLLTFDDGFRGVFEHGYPLLRSMQWPFTVFLVSGLIGARSQWMAEERSELSLPLLDAAQIREMAANGIDFQSHTRSHRHLTCLSDEELREELCASMRDLEQLLRRPVRYLAYPFGSTDPRVVEAARRVGYRGAFSVQPGFNRRSVDPFLVRRLDVFGSDSSPALLRKLWLGSNDGSISNVLHYYAGRLRKRFPYGTTA